MSVARQTGTDGQNEGKQFVPAGTAFGCPREFLGNRFVYTVISPRARGLSVGVNMNPDKRCNFDCAYCEVNRSEPATKTPLDEPIMITELLASTGAESTEPRRPLLQDGLQQSILAARADGGSLIAGT